MSNDGARWCNNGEEDDERRNISQASHADSYTFQSVYHLKEKQNDQISVINIHKHRNVRLMRDSRRNNITVDSTQLPLSSQKCLNRSLYLITVILLHLLCNLINYVECDDSVKGVTGAGGHFTHTWAVHIPGGERIARDVAEEHGMIFRGKVSEGIFFRIQILLLPSLYNIRKTVILKSFTNNLQNR